MFYSVPILTYNLMPSHIFLQLQITVNAEDDNPPVLTKTSYTETISNDTGVGAVFGNADATDDDFLAKHRRHKYKTDSRFVYFIMSLYMA